MKIKDTNPRNVKNNLIYGFFEQDISSVLFRNMDNGKWKAYTLFGFQEKNYKVRITEGEGQTVENGFSIQLSENTLETLISMNMRSGEYQRLILKAAEWNDVDVTTTKVSVVK